MTRYTVPELNTRLAVEKRRKWAIGLALLTLPCFPVGLVLPLFVLFEANKLEQSRGLTLSQTETGWSLRFGNHVEHLRKGTAHASTVRDLVVLSAETETGRKYWNLPIGADSGTALIAAVEGLGISVVRSAPLDARDGAALLAVVILDRLLATFAAFSALAVVLAGIGAALGAQSPLWIVPAFVGVFVLLLLQALLRRTGWGPMRK